MELDALVSGLRTEIPEAEIALRLALAIVFGAVIGFEREVNDHAAGLRTHMLTSLAAATFTVLTFELFREAQARDEQTNADPIRIVEAVTAGVAFLAAGAIISGRGRVRGLTTGAGMWLAGSVGLACGAGRYLIAAMATILALMVLTWVKRFEKRFLDDASSSSNQAADD